MIRSELGRLAAGPRGPAAERLQAWGLALLAGVLVGLPHVSIGLGPLPYLGLALLCASVEWASSQREVLGWGLWMGMASQVTVFGFLLYPLIHHSGFALPLALLLFAAHTMIFGTRFAMMGWLLWRLRHHAGLSLPLAAALAGVTADLLQVSLFPLHIGSTQLVDLWLMQWADLVGIHGVTAIVCAVAAWLALVGLEAERRPRNLAVLALVLVVVHGYGAWRLAQVEALEAVAPRWSVGLIQPNTTMQWRRPDQVDAGLAAAATCERLTRRVVAALPGGCDLVVWPEACTPFSCVPSAERINEAYCAPACGATSENPVAEAQASYAAQVRRLAQALRVPLLVGEPLRHEGRAYNGVRLISAAGEPAGCYLKMLLLPFVEYTPLRGLLPDAGSGPPPGERTPGTTLRGLDLPSPRGERALRPVLEGVAVQICYEIMFGEPTRKLVRQGARLLVNPANDAWFGPTSATQGHMLEAYARALETRRPLVRCANSGTSTVVAASGRFVCAPTRTFVEASLAAQVACPAVLTPYVRWGDGPAWIVAALTALLAARRPRGVASAPAR